MKIRFASALLALTLPLCAQEPAAAETEAMFYKAFYMEKGQRDFVGAMELYQKFLDKAPEHKLAGEAAKSQFQLLVKTGKTKESEAFKTKYEKLIGNVAATPAPAAGGAAGGEGQRRGGEGRPEGAGAGAGAGGRGQGGPGGMGGRGAMGALRGTKKITEMTDEELGQLKEGLNGMTRMLDMMRENGQEETADKVEAASTSLKKALEANNKEEAQKALDTLRTSMPQRRGRGEGGGQGGGPGGGAGGGQGGGRGGNTGGGAGGNSGGGGGNSGGGGGGL